VNKYGFKSKLFADAMPLCSLEKRQKDFALYRVQRAFGCCVEGHGLVRTIGEGRMVGLDDPVGLFQVVSFQGFRQNLHLIMDVGAQTHEAQRGGFDLG